MHNGATICIGNYSELLSEHVLSIAEMSAYNRQKRSSKHINDKHVLCFVDRWWGCTWALVEKCKKPCPWVQLQWNLGRSRKRTYIIFVTPRWAYSWRNLACEGLSRRTARATTVGGTVKTRVQVMVKVIIILCQSSWNRKVPSQRFKCNPDFWIAVCELGSEIK